MSNNGGRAVIDPALAAMAQQAAAINRSPEPPTRSLHDEAKPHPWDEMRPTKHWVLVEQVSTEERTIGGVIIPEAAQQAHWMVAAVGPLVTDLKRGDFILAGGTQGVPVRVLEGRTFAMLWHGDEPPVDQIPAIMPAPDMTRAKVNPLSNLVVES